MSDSDDDLYGVQLVLLLVFFGAVGGGLYLISWLTRPGFLYDHPIACAAIAGFLCYPARFLAERFAWWNRLEERRQARAKRRAARPSRPASRARRIAGRIVRVVIGLPILLVSLAFVPDVILSSRDDVRLIEAGPVQSARVVEVKVDRWSDDGTVTVKVARPGDGVPIELDGGDQLEPTPVVGDQVDVVVDPDDPSYILAAAVDQGMPWWSYPLVIGLALIGLAFGWFTAFG
ncbi:hypothetical protein ACI2LF_27320 [Kribbella sp. NPDC020789]